MSDQPSDPPTSGSNDGAAEALPPSALRWVCPLDALDFETTAELEPTNAIIGQDAATESLRFGLRFRAPGQHVFVRGPIGSGRLTLIRRMLDEPEPLPETARDRVVVMDFDEPDRPALISLRLGQAPSFVEAVEGVAQFIRDDLLGEVEARVAVAKQALDQAAQHTLAEHAQPFEAGLAEAGLALARITDDDGESETRVLPVVDGQPVQLPELEAMAARGEIDAEKLGETMAAIARFTAHLADVTQRANAVQREHQSKVERLFKDAVVDVLNEVVAPHRETWPLATVRAGSWFDQIVRHVAKRLDVLAESPEAWVDLLKVNVLLTRPEGARRPVVIETTPSVQSLLGTIDLPTIEGMPPHLGIRAGDLLRADGGTLVLDARAMLMRDGAWEALARALETGLVEQMPDASPTTLRPPGIKPHPVPIDVKVVLFGDPLIYHALDQSDPLFPQQFKILADLDDTLPATPEAIRAFAASLAGLAQREGLPSFQRGAVAALVEHAARIAADDGQLTARLGRLNDIAREAAFLANGAPVVRDHVDDAIRRTKRRADGPGRRFRERVARGAIQLNTQGRSVGEINGLAVISAGPLTYGMPMRITATAGPGSGGAINVEQEALLSGQIHVKSFHILSGLLRRLIDAPHPLTFDASIAFEQSYGGVDGDSASAASFLVLLSAITGLPIRQDLAITGAIDQVGHILPIGAVNEKAEGFYDCCRSAGLTGTQGVVIPQSNAADLMLRSDVVQAASDGQFSVFPVERIEGCIALFFGQDADDVLTAARAQLDAFWKATGKQGAGRNWSLRRQLKRVSLESGR
jgi:ATP-dependent Lon protease